MNHIDYRTLDCAIAQELGLKPPSDYKFNRVDGDWETLGPEYYDDGSMSRTLSVMKWPPYYSLNSNDIESVIFDSLKKGELKSYLLTISDSYEPVAVLTLKDGSTLTRSAISFALASAFTFLKFLEQG